MRRGQANRWVYEVFPGACKECRTKEATYTIHRDGKALRLCAGCLLAFKALERQG